METAAPPRLTTRSTPSTRQLASGMRTWRFLGVLLAIYFLLLGAITQLAPLLYMVSTSLKDQQGIFSLPIRWIPDPIRWENYIQVWSQISLWRGFANSLLIASTTTPSAMPNATTRTTSLR